MSSESYHEREDLLSESTKNLHRANVSLREELEAVDWYQQRAEACTDPDLKAILIHNKNEELEHAMMALEWMRRKDPKLAEHIATYINAKGDILAAESAAKSDGGGGESKTQSPSLGIGSLKGRR